MTPAVIGPMWIPTRMASFVGAAPGFSVGLLPSRCSAPKPAAWPDAGRLPITGEVLPACRAGTTGEADPDEEAGGPVIVAAKPPAEGERIIVGALAPSSAGTETERAELEREAPAELLPSVSLSKPRITRSSMAPIASIMSSPMRVMSTSGETTGVSHGKPVTIM
jgi:hypothetical protein